MYLIDKYEPKRDTDLFFHKEIFDKIKIMALDDSIPHIIFYGPEGSGKKTVVKFLLKYLYDETALNTIDVIYSVSGSSNSSTDVTVKQSNYHLEIKPFSTNFDRYLIQDIVKKYATRKPMEIFQTKRNFKIVIIHNIDCLLYYAQTSLRRTLEKYSDTCRFVLWCHSLSKVIEPLRSRCVCMKIPAPSNDKMFERIYKITTYENLNLSLEQLTHIITTANGNIKKAIWGIDMYRNAQEFVTSYDKALCLIYRYILAGDLNKIRDLVNLILKTNIPGSKIIYDITTLILNSDIDSNYKMSVISKASTYEYNLIKGRHEIIHIEAFIHNIIQAL